MKRFVTTLFTATALIAPLAFVACGGDDDDTNDSSTGGTGGQAGDSSSSGGTGTGGETTGEAGSGTGGSATGGTGNGGGGEAGGPGGDPEPACDVDSRGSKTIEVLEGTIDKNTTLDANKVYQLKKLVYVAPGVTLTVPACTRIEGIYSDTKTENGGLIVMRGARLVANGTAKRPILFTSVSSHSGSPKPGDWGGLVILGSAPVSLGDDVQFEGLAADDTRHQFGGTKKDDDSGSLKYVRIEYSGVDLGFGKEINGLSLGGVGNKTVLENIIVRNTKDDCFEWFGGTVSAKNLIADGCGDDQYDTDDGWQGTVTNAFGRAPDATSSDPAGFEWDGTTDTKGGFQTKSNFENVTLCGKDSQYAMVLRRGIEGSIKSGVFVGFPTGVDVRDLAAEAAFPLSITGSTVVADAVGDADGDKDDDNGFDDSKWFTGGTNNVTTSPGFTADDCLKGGAPDAKITGSGKGAFKDGADWIKGEWTGW
jgi:hypothetical protein